MHENPNEIKPMTQAEGLAQVVNNPESIIDPVDDDLAKLHERLAASWSPKAPEAVPDAPTTPEGVAGAAVHSRGGAADGEFHFGQLASEMVKVPVSESAASTGRTGPIDSQMTRGRRSRGRAVSPPASAPVPPAQPPVPPAEKKPAKAEKEPIVPGKYRDADDILCEVYRQGDDFSYKILEGKNEGQIILVQDESQFRALMGDEWKKVDDTTEPKVAEPAETTAAELEQEEQLEGYELEEGQMWTREIKVDGKDGREFIEIEKISGDTIEILRQRQGIDLFEDGQSESLDAVALEEILKEGMFKLEKGLVSVVSASSENPDRVRTEKGADGSETGHFYPLANIGDTAVYDSADGKVTVLRTPEGYLVKTPGMNDTKTDERGVASFVETNNWTRESQTTSFSVDVNPAEKPTVDIELPLGEGEATPEQFLDNLPEGGSFSIKSKKGRQTRHFTKSGDGFMNVKSGKLEEKAYLLELFKNGWTLNPLEAEAVEAPKAETRDSAEQYQELFQGDIWVMRDEQGKFMQAFAIGPIYTLGGKSQVNVFKLGEDLVIPDAPQDFEEVEQTKGIVMDLEDLRGDLERNKYTRETKGTVSEKNIENRTGESHFVHLENIGDEATYVRKKDFLDDDGLAIVRVKRAERRQGGEKGTMVQGYLVADAAVGTKFVALDAIEAVAQAEGWIPSESADTLPIDKTPEMPKFFEEVDKEKSEIGELRERVELLREAYVKIDYEQETAFKKITGVLRFLTGQERNDKDTEEARQAYEQALMNLQEAELAEIKTSGLGGVFLKERMAGMLHYYKFSERVNLYNDRLEIEAQQKKWPQKAWDALESVGKKYNALPPKVKIAIAVTTLAGAGGLAFAGAAGTAAGVLALRRVVSSLAAGVSLDELSKQGAEYLRKRSASKEEEQETGELGALATPLVEPAEKPRKSPLEYVDPSLEEVKEISSEQQEALDRLKALVTKDILGLDKKFQNQKSEKLFRKTAIWGTAVAASSYFTVKGFSGVMASQEGDIDEALRDLREQTGTPAPAENAASAPVAAASGAAQSGASAEVINADNRIPNALNQHLFTETPASTQGVSEVAVSGKVEALLGKHDVTSADSRGLWGIFEQRLPAGFEGDKNKAIQSLNNLVAEKVKNMSPEQLKEVGLRTNDINKIYPGDKIDFSKLFTKEEIQSVLDGKTIASPGLVEKAVGGSDVLRKGVETAAQTLSPQEAALKAAESEMIAMEQAKEAASLNMAQEEMIAQELAKDKIDPFEDAVKGVSGKSLAQVASPYEDVVSARPVVVAAETKMPGNPFELKSLKVFLQENPDRIPEFKNTLIGIRQTMFETSDIEMMNPAKAAYFDYRLQPMMGKVDMLRVLEYSRDLRTGALQEYAFNQSGGPIHTSQIRQLAHLVQVAQDPRMFGTFGQVIRGENIEAYTRRIAALATATNKTPQLAMMLTGRTRSMI